MRFNRPTEKTIIFTSLANREPSTRGEWPGDPEACKAHVRRSTDKRNTQPAFLTRAERTLLVLAVITVASWLGYAAVASAAEPPRVQRCSFVYINGDAVISCPKVSK